MTTQTKDFTHLDENNQATIVDIESKKITTRIAVAQSRVFLPQDVLVNFVNGEIVSKKGAVFQSAIIAGIMAAKKHLT